MESVYERLHQLQLRMSPTCLGQFLRFRNTKAQSALRTKLASPTQVLRLPTEHANDSAMGFKLHRFDRRAATLGKTRRAAGYQTARPLILLSADHETRWQRSASFSINLACALPESPSSVRSTLSPIHPTELCYSSKLSVKERAVSDCRSGSC